MITTKWFAGLNALFGLWLIAVPFVISVPNAAMWNAVIVGGLVATLGGYNYYLTTQGREVSVGAATTNAILGLWVIFAPFALHVGTTALWNDVVVGSLIALFAGYNGYEASRTAGATGQTA